MGTSCERSFNITEIGGSIAHDVGELKAWLTIVEGHNMSSEDDEQGDKSPLESNWWEETPPDPYPAAMDKELRYDQLQSRPIPVQQFMSARSTRFQQMNKCPSEDDDRQEPIIKGRSRNMRSESTELADNLWTTHIEASFASLDEVECMRSIQPNKQMAMLHASQVSPRLPGLHPLHNQLPVSTSPQWCPLLA